MAPGSLQRPQGKVLRGADGLFVPSLVWENRRLRLGRHASEEVAQACYDAAKLLLVRKLGGESESFKGLKLHREAACYTSHPLWAQLTSAQCSFEEACRLLAGGAAETLLAAPASCRGLGQKRPAASAAADGPEQEPRSKQQRHTSSCARCGTGKPGGTAQPPGQQGLCMACSRLVPGQPAAATVQRSGSGGGGTAADADASTRAPAPGQKFRHTSWSGLEPADCGAYCIRLPCSVTDGKCGVISAPTRYARAVFGGDAGNPDLPTTVTLALAGDGRQFRCGLAFRTHGYSLSGLRLPLQALGVAPGSQLRFVPAGRGTATISLVRAGCEADAATASSDAAEGAAAAELEEGGKTQAAAQQPQAGKTSQLRALEQLFGSDSE